LEFAFGHYVEMSSVTLIFANHRHKPVDLLGGFEAYSALLKEMQPHSHQERPTHGDIKPANIMFSPSQEAASAVLISEDGTVTEENRMGLPPQSSEWTRSHRRVRRPMLASFGNSEAARIVGPERVCDRCSGAAAEATSMVEFSPEAFVQHTCATNSQVWEPDESINDYISWDRGLENSDWNSTERRPGGWTSFRCDSCTLEKSSSSFTSLGNEDLDEAPY
jgi:serine/threonine protein kinase